MATITKQDLVYRISERIGQKKVVTKQIIQGFIDEIVRELERGNLLEFREFGVFELKERAARKARNPRTGQRVDVPEKFVVTFKPGKEMEEKVRQLEAKKRAAQGAAPLGNNGSGESQSVVQPSAQSPTGT